MRLRMFCPCLCPPFLLRQAIVPESAAGGVPTGAFYRFKVGDVSVTALSDGVVELDLRALLGGIPESELEALLALQGARTPLRTSINAYLVETAGRRILIDTGAGALFAPRAGELAASLRAAGVEINTIDTILLTHVHADHSGGLTIGDAAAFPAATVLVEETDRDHWFSEEDEQRAPPHRRHSFAQGRASLRPYIDSGRLRTFHGETEVAPRIRALPAPGHTPGHTVYVIESQGVRMMVWGDVLHAGAVQFPRPEVTVKFDSDEPAAAKQRRAILDQVSTHDYLVAAAHLDFPGLGRVRRNGNRYAWEPVAAGC